MANNRFKVDNGLVVTGNTEFYQRIDSYANAHFQNDLFVVSGNLTVNGTLVYANVVVGQGGIRAIADQQDLGNTTNRFNLFGYRVQIDDSLVPLANGVAAGNTTRRFEVFANNLNATTITVGSGGSINATYFNGTASNANTINGLYANGFIVRTSNTGAVARSINVSSNGITITNGDGISGNPTLALALGAGHFANTTGLYVNLSSVGVGTLPIARGGTGGPDRTTAINNLLPSQSGVGSGYVLATNGLDPYWTSAVGPIGYTGSKGDTGATGSQGVIGYTGSAGTNGSDGYTGSRGYTGSQGPTGSQGVIGYTGSSGTNGTNGATGYTGSAGAGYTGSQGVIGYTGSAGTNGYTGSKGDTGATGSQGPAGSAGSQGPIGYTGSATPGTLYNVTSGYTSGGKMFITSSTPSATAAGDLWFDTGSGGYTQSLAGNGWMKLPNGVIIQWGTVYTSPNSNGSGSFPTTFPTQCFSAVMNGVGETGTYGGQGGDPTIYSFSTSTFYWHSGDDNGCYAYYIAIGY